MIIGVEINIHLISVVHGIQLGRRKSSSQRKTHNPSESAPRPVRLRIAKEKKNICNPGLAGHNNPKITHKKTTHRRRLIGGTTQRGHIRLRATRLQCDGGKWCGVDDNILVRVRRRAVIGLPRWASLVRSSTAARARLFRVPLGSRACVCACVCGVCSCVQSVPCVCCGCWTEVGECGMNA